MYLQNGKFYTTADGTPVKAQLEGDGQFHCYDITGSEIHTVKSGGHVEGWLPCGRQIFKAAKEKAEADKKKAREDKQAKKASDKSDK